MFSSFQSAEPGATEDGGGRGRALDYSSSLADKAMVCPPSMSTRDGTSGATAGMSVSTSEPRPASSAGGEDGHVCISGVRQAFEMDGISPVESWQISHAVLEGWDPKNSIMFTPKNRYHFAVDDRSVCFTTCK